MSKIFLSILGTSNYQPCNYQFRNGDTVRDVRFIQEASIQHFCAGWSPENGDRIRIFCTPKAIDMNWVDNGHIHLQTKEPIACEGLKTRLSILFSLPEYLFDVDTILKEIPDGRNEQEIWEIFTIIFNELERDDEIWFDITHGFRSLPMLVFSIASYARHLKKVHIRSVSYGAFEARRDGIDPVFDLTDFIRLMNWTDAAKDFVEYGKPHRMAEYVKVRASETHGQDEQIRVSNQFANFIKKFAQTIQENRLEKIIEFGNLTTILANYFQAVGQEIHTFTPLIEEIKSKTNQFTSNSMGNIFAAVRWCHQHEMYQNGYSILLEGCISIALAAINKPWSGQNRQVMELRDLVAIVVKIQAGLLTQDNLDEWARPLSDDLNQLQTVISPETGKDLHKIYNYRNAYMHAGTGTNVIPGDIIDKLPFFTDCLENWYKKLVAKGHINLLKDR